VGAGDARSVGERAAYMEVMALRQTHGMLGSKGFSAPELR
jgi:hypothetical protein